MADRIYVQQDNKLCPMDVTTYESEDLLQDYLAHNPDLLAGDQIDIVNPRRWLFITREIAISDDEDGRRRWSLDHLFLDQDGIPTLVETKRSTDTRLRREVVGQMLDYAANAVAFWPVESIKLEFEKRCRLTHKDPDDELLQCFCDVLDVDAFWQTVKTNLQAGRIRLLFVSDVIPPELRQIVDFMNSQMSFAEVLAIEVKRYRAADQGHQSGLVAFVPRLVTRTRTIEQSGSRASILEEKFLRAFDFRHDRELQTVLRRLIQWAKDQNLDAEFKEGKRGAVFLLGVHVRGNLVNPLTVNANGEIRLQMRHLCKHAPFNDEKKRAFLQRKLESAVKLELTEAGMRGLPCFPVSSLVDADVLGKVIETFDWMVLEIKQADSSVPSATTEPSPIV